MRHVAPINQNKDVATREYVKSFAETTGTNSYLITLTPAPATLAELEGLAIRVKVGNASTGTVSLAVNGLTAVNVVLSDGTQANTWRSGSIYTVVYNNTTGLFIQQGEGGGVVNDSASVYSLVDENVSANDIVKSNYQALIEESLAKFTPVSSVSGFGSFAAQLKGTNYWVTVNSANPFISIYNDTTRLANAVPSQPSSLVRCVSSSPDGTTLCASVNNANSLAVWRRTHEFWDRITVTQPPSTTGNTGWGLDWSPNNLYFAIGTTNTPFLHFYRRPLVSAAGSEVPVRITSPFSDSLPTGIVGGVSFSPNSKYLVAHQQSGNVIYTFKWNESTTAPAWSRVASGTITGVGNSSYEVEGLANTVNWSPDGNYISVISSQSGYPSLSIYKFNATTESFSSVYTYTVSTVGKALYASWSPSGAYVLLSYRRTSDSALNAHFVKRTPKTDTFSLSWASLFSAYTFALWDSNNTGIRSYDTSYTMTGSPIFIKAVGTDAIGPYDKDIGIALSSVSAGNFVNIKLLAGG